MPKNKLKTSHLQSLYPREALLEFAKAKGVSFAEITPKIPSKVQVLNQITAKDKKAVAELEEINELRQRLKLWTLTEKAKELGVYDDGLKKITLAVRIYCKDSDALRDLQRYQRTEPKQSTLAFVSKKEIPAEKLCDESALRTIVEQKLTTGNDAIATLDALARVGDNVRYVVNLDNKKKTVERSPSVKFPGRKGTHDDFPLKRVVATYNLKSGILQVSALKDKAEQVVRCISEAACGNEDLFEEDKPSMDKASLIFTDSDLQAACQESDIKLVELKLLRLPLEGGISMLHLQGDNVFDTIRQFQAASLPPIVGDGASEIALLTFMLNNKKMTLDFTRGNARTVGKFTDEELAKMSDVMKRWGIYRKIY